MADDPKNEGAPEEGAKSKKKLFIIIGAATAAVLVLGIAAFFMLSGGKHESAPANTAESSEHDKKEKGGEAKEGHGEAKAGHGEAAKEGEKAEGGEHGEKAEEGHGEGKEKKGAESGGHGEKGGEGKEGHGEGDKGKKDAKKSEAKDEGVNFGRTYSFTPFQLNLGNPMENRYLRLEISIEYKNGDPQLKEIEARKSQLRDAVVSVASRKTREFLLGPDGKDQLRLEILNRINQYMDMKIEAVYITDILIE